MSIFIITVFIHIDVGRYRYLADMDRYRNIDITSDIHLDL